MLYLGKRNLGVGTAASPGDTLIFPFATYNDSGASIGIGGTLAVTDIEVFKDGVATARATDSGYSLISDTGQMGDRVGLHRVRIQLYNTADDASFYASGSSYQVAIDSITVDSRTVRAWVGTFEIGEPRANVIALNGDTGAANWLKTVYLNGFTDTGLQERLGRIQSDVDTGLRVHIDDSDTGLKDVIADLDTGLRDFIADAKNELDTGIKFRLPAALGDNGNMKADIRDIIGSAAAAFSNRLSVNVTHTNGVVLSTDSNNAPIVNTQYIGGSGGSEIQQSGGYVKISSGTGTGQVSLAAGIAAVNLTQIAGDTGAAGWLKSTFAAGFTDTGVNERLARIQSDVDTGLRTHVDDLDTGLHAHISDVDTGIHDTLSDYDTGLRGILQTTGIVVSAFSDTGVNERLGRIQSDVDTGLRTHIDDLDTGLHAHISDVDTGIHDTLSDYDTGVRGILTTITGQTNKMTFDTGNWLQSDVRKVNNVRVLGTGDTGTSDHWRPGP